jgi:hypothetical protein
MVGDGRVLDRTIVDKPRVRTREPFRRQRLFCFETLEGTIAAGHRARLPWRVVETLDLSDFLEGRRALEGQAGRAVISVRMLLTLWLYATSVGWAAPGRSPAG